MTTDTLIFREIKRILTTLDNSEERLRFRSLIRDLSLHHIVLFSTPISEDIEMTSDRVCVLNHGNLMFFDSLQDIVELAKGKVWNIKVDLTQFHSFRRREESLIVASSKDNTYFVRTVYLLHLASEICSKHNRTLGFQNELVGPAGCRVLYHNVGVIGVFRHENVQGPLAEAELAAVDAGQPAALVPGELRLHPALFQHVRIQHVQRLLPVIHLDREPTPEQAPLPQLHLVQLRDLLARKAGCRVYRNLLVQLRDLPAAIGKRHNPAAYLDGLLAKHIRQDAFTQRILQAFGRLPVLGQTERTRHQQCSAVLPDRQMRFH